MFKFIVLTAILAVTSAHVIAPAVHYEAAPVITETILKPKLEIPVVKTAIISEPSHIEVHEPTVVRVGEHVESVPTAVSHQSSTVVHSRAKIVTPIVAPAVKTHIAPVVKTYETPIYETPLPAPAPIFKTIESAPILKTYETAPIAPLHYAAAAPVLTRAVHYAAAPVFTGYSETILKPKLHASFLSAAPALTYATRPEFHYPAPAPLELSKEIRYSEPIEHSFPYPAAEETAW